MAAATSRINYDRTRRFRTRAGARPDKVRKCVVIQKNIFIVAPDTGASGKWNVVEERLARAVTRFDDKDDAIDYATELAKAEPSSRVDVRNKTGSTEATLDFESDGSGGKR